MSLSDTDNFAELQHALAVWLKLTEIQKLLESFAARAAERFGGEGDWRRGMFLALKPLLRDDQQRMIEFLEYFLQYL
ncbi:MAG: hypothetical protein FWC55_02815 [Firmicutes bacterium]|nr:hypothetical protein [Bacillota bacterium]